MWHETMYVHISGKIANKHIPRKCLWDDLHRIHRIPGRAPSHIGLRRIHLLRSGSNHVLLIAGASTNIHRYIVVVRWWIPCLPLLCLWWLALLCLLLLLRLVVRIVCVRRHSRRRDSCCRAVRRRCSYSFGCSTGEIPPAGSTIATATVGAAALSRATQLLLAVPVLGVCCFQACVHDLE